MEESFFDGMDMSVVDGAQAEEYVAQHGHMQLEMDTAPCKRNPRDGATLTNSHTAPPAAPPAVQQTSAPAYQHRYRPDPPATTKHDNSPPMQQEGDSGPSDRTPGDSDLPVAPRSSGNTGQTRHEQAGPSRSRGGFNFPNGNGSGSNVSALQLANLRAGWIADQAGR
jgi:hypothetical protein